MIKKDIEFKTFFTQYLFEKLSLTDVNLETNIETNLEKMKTFINCRPLD